MNNSMDERSAIVTNVREAVHKFNHDNPDETILVATATKARRTDNENNVGAGFGWATARRAPLILTERAFYCGDWEIPINKLKYAEYVAIPSVFGMKSIVIKIAENDGNHYQFSVKDVDDWRQQEVVKFKKGELVSWFPIYIWATRLFLLGLLIYGLLSTFDIVP